MKRKMLFAVAALVLLVGMQTLVAQNENKSVLPRHYLQVNVGDPLFNTLYSSPWRDEIFTSGYAGDAWFKPDVYQSAYSLLPTFSFSYYYAIKPWLLLGGEIYYTGEYNVVRDRITNQKLGISGKTGLSILPAIRFQYLNKRYVGLYSGVSFGVYMCMEQGFKLYDPDERNRVYTLPAFQITALGVRVGNKVYGTAEIGLGNKGVFALGVGTRF